MGSRERLGPHRVVGTPRPSIRMLVALSGALVLGGSARGDGVPLDPFDPTPREILVEKEISTDPGAVGQLYGPPLPASYSASGGIGTIVIPIESHEQMRVGAFEPVPGSFTPLGIEVDLVGLSATSQSASGAFESGGQLTAFEQHPLGSDTTGGYVSTQATFLYCSSQQEVDDLCQVNPGFCGLTCVIVPGAAYDPATGQMNLVGSESVEGCDGPFCFGPFLLFSQAGDLRFRELTAPAVPALQAPAGFVLAASLLALGWRMRSGGR